MTIGYPGGGPATDPAAAARDLAAGGLGPSGDLLRGAAEEAGAGARRTARHKVLKAAQITYGSAALNCIVLDLSVRGARVNLAAPAEVPENVTLRLRDGTHYPARRRWARGTEIGLEFAGRGRAAGADETLGDRARAALQAVRAADPNNWLPLLQRDRYFGDEAVREAAVTAEIALLRLEAALRQHAAAGEEGR